MNKYVLQEIMSLPKENNVGLIISINILNKYVQVKLVNGKDNTIFYEVNVNDLLVSEITTEELIQIRNANWELIENNKLINKLT